MRFISSTPPNRCLKSKAMPCDGYRRSVSIEIHKKATTVSHASSQILTLPRRKSLATQCARLTVSSTENRSPRISMRRKAPPPEAAGCSLFAPVVAGGHRLGARLCASAAVPADASRPVSSLSETTMTSSAFRFAAMSLRLTMMMIASLECEVGEAVKRMSR